MHKTITLLTSGTRGDVEPFIALGMGLQRAGYRIQIATHASFRALIEQRGLSFVQIEGNPSELMTRPGGQSALAFDGNWLRSARATLDYMRAARPVYERMLASAWQACRDADALIIGLPTMWGAHIAKVRRIPCVGGLLQPLSRTRAFPSALLPSTFSLGPTYNWLTHLAVEQAVWLPWRATINRWRRDALSLSPAPVVGRPFELPIVYGFSSHVVPRPTDWPDSHVITGYWFLDSVTLIPVPAKCPGGRREAHPRPVGEGRGEGNEELERFIEAGPPPVYVGFGSPGMRQPAETIAIVVRALEANHLRAVLALPHDVETMPLPDTILRIADAPHAWLFPRVAAVVHHGGAGTTAASLRAGVPTLVTPMAVDQFFWGKRVTDLGVGPRPIPRRALDVDKLAQALRQATHDEAMRARAQSLGHEIRSEDGVQRAVEVIRWMV